MMQSRRREHGSSGELDVFGATSYFAGLPPPAPDDDDDCRQSSATEPPPSADRLYLQVVQRDTTRMATTEGNSFRGPHQQQQQLAVLRGHAERHANNKQLVQVAVAAKRRPQPSSGKSKLAALLSFMVSPSQSFRKDERKQEAPSSTTSRRRQAAAAAGGEKETSNNNTYKAANSPSSSSSPRKSSGGMQLQGLFGAHDDELDLDLGVATGDRRLQGITVVRGIGGGQERWVVRCVPGPGGGAWEDEEHREKMLDVDVDAEESASSERNIKDEVLLAEVEQRVHDDDGGGNNIDPAHSWDSDCSSDLFDLDLEYR